MALTTHLSGYVDSKVQGRGYSYYRSGAVQITNGNEKELQAVVIGSDTYEVDLYREGDTVYVFCTCPYFEGERVTCKHIWATLLAAEKQGYLRGKSNSDPVHLEIDDEDDDWDENEEGDWDEGDELEDEDEILSRFTPRPPILPAPRDDAIFNWFLHRPDGKIIWLPCAGLCRHSRKMRKAVGRRARQILYFVDVPATLEGKGLVIEVVHREMKKNGEWGKQKSLSDSYCKPENLPDPEDQRIWPCCWGAGTPPAGMATPAMAITEEEVFAVSCLAPCRNI